MLDLENSLEVLKKLPMANYFSLPINSKIEDFERQINKVGFPCWIKLSTSLHKEKIHALERCESLDQLKQAYTNLKKKFPDKKFIIQEEIKGTEILVGLKKDKVFNKVLIIGAGGNLTEIIKDVSFLILPATLSEINTTLRKLKIHKLLEEENLSTSKLVKLIKLFSDLAEKEDIEEADLNPIIVNKKQALIVDARIEI